MMKTKNRNREKIKLTNKMTLFMKPRFPHIDFGKVTLITGAELLFVSSERNGLALGYDIYIRETWGPPMHGECSKRRMKLLLHELVHVQQYQLHLVHGTYACHYLFEFVAAGYSYENNLLEREAVAFERSQEESLYATMEKHCVDLYE